MGNYSEADKLAAKFVEIENTTSENERLKKVEAVTLEGRRAGINPATLFGRVHALYKKKNGKWVKR